MEDLYFFNLRERRDFEVAQTFGFFILINNQDLCNPKISTIYWLIKREEEQIEKWVSVVYYGLFEC
jgi:hypothetical protein